MKFIHFGCWNKGKCSEESPTSNGLSEMTHLLRNYIDRNEVDFITIAGDNYYPDKKPIGPEVEGAKQQKVKKFNKGDFDSGFGCLPLSVKKYVLFGNHDMEDNVVDDDGTKHQCKALLLQQELGKTYPTNTSYEFFDDVMIQIRDNTLIIMLDTSIYSFKPTTPIIETCYQHIFSSQKQKLIDDPDGYQIKDLIDYQKQKIINAIEKNTCENIIFIGHHPIISKVSKTLEGKPQINKFKPEDGLINFFNDISVVSVGNVGSNNSINSILQGRNIYYLCADTHFYQYGIVSTGGLDINQYIVGTGGADQDELPIDEAEENTTYKTKIDRVINKVSYDVSYVIKEQKKTFGFLVVNIDDTVSFKYVDKDNTTEVQSLEGGYYAKYLKYKMKYLKLKNNL